MLAGVDPLSGVFENAVGGADIVMHLLLKAALGIFWVIIAMRIRD
jgi:hypothetical protein